MACHAVTRAVVGPGIDPPAAGTADVGAPRTEAVAAQAEETEHHIRGGPGVGHDLRGLQRCVLFERAREQHQAVAQRPRDRNAVQAGALIGHEVVEGDAPADTEVLGGGRVHGAPRHHEAPAVGGGHLTPAPGARPGDPGVRRDEARGRRAHGLVAQVMLADPGQAIAPRGR